MQNENFRQSPRAEPISAAGMRATERAAIASGAVTGLALMERAGAGVVDAILARWPDLNAGPRRAIVLCGPGNNGGDGFVIACLLTSRGWDVQVFLGGDAETLPPDARTNHHRWARMGAVQPLTAAALMQALDAIAQGPPAPVPVIDALFGIGQRAPMQPILAPVNAMIDVWRDRLAEVGAPRFVTVDIPTGYDADSGAALAPRPMPSDLIVTFHRPKPIHAMPHMQGPRCVVVDIGLSVFVPKKSPPEA